MRKIDELKQELESMKNEAQSLISDKKVEEAKAKMEEIKNQKALIEAQEVLDREEEEKLRDDPKGKEEVKKNKSGVKMVNAFVGLIKSALKKETPNPEDAEVYNAVMTEGVPADGGLTVPPDISTEIRQMRRAEDALENLVHVESVTTENGSRVYEVAADQVPFDNVDEAADFPEMPNPTFKKVDYKVKKKGGIMKLTRELMQDTAENIMGVIQRWIAKKAKATRNALIISTIDTITKSKEVPIASIDDLKDIFNVKLDPSIALTSKVVTNQDGFNFLDKLKDTDGNYILQKNPTDSTEKMLFGRYKVIVVSNKVLKTVTNKAPVICGDLKEAITIFDREHLTIEISSEAGDLWQKDLTGIKARERLDIKAVDEEAIVKGQIDLTGGVAAAYAVPVSDTENTVQYTEAELNSMTVEQIKALAVERGYTITKTVKAEIISEFIKQQG